MKSDMSKAKADTCSAEDIAEAKPYLYRMRRVHYKHRGFPHDSKQKWKSYINDLHEEIRQTCREELTDPAKVLHDSENYDIVASVLGLKESVSAPRDNTVESSVETLDQLPQTYAAIGRSKKSLGKSLDLGLDNNLMITSSSLSQPSSSFIEYQGKADSRIERSDSQSGVESISDYFDDDFGHLDDDDVYVNPPTPPPEEDLEPWVDKRSPYQRFFSLAEYKATRWRRGFSDSKPKELLTVQEKEEHLYNSIASDFCKWVSECQFKNVQLDETTVTELFQVGMETPAVKAMCVQTKELPIVPAQVAQIFNMPEKSEMAGLRKQVQWDIKFAQMKEKGILDKPQWKYGHREAKPHDTRRPSKQPRSNETLHRWFTTNLLNKEEKTGEMLWAQLEKTKVFKHFCNWLIENNKYKKPQYLDKKGYFKNKYHIDESDMIRVVRMESESTPIESTVMSARNNLESLVSTDNTYGAILEDLVLDIPSLKPFLGFDVTSKKWKAAKDKRKKAEEYSSPVKPLTQGMREERQDNTVHHMALINHPEWP